jgi:saccharopine dehydrogenase-like NADP-dependent oxidoreductase
MSYDFLVLGGDGMQGRIVARFLLRKGHSLFGADLHDYNLKRMGILTKNNFGFSLVDIRDEVALRKLIREVNPKVVINCADEEWNLNVYLACLAEKRHVVDLGSSIQHTRHQLGLHSEFKKQGITAITGCGSTPGINNVMLGYAVKEFDTIDTVEAGFAWDSNDKIFVTPFSLNAILGEITDPAPYIEDRVWHRTAPLRTLERRPFETIGMQPVFLVHHAETFTFYRHCKDKGVRDVKYYASFPDHSMHVLEALAAMGFGNGEKSIAVGEENIKPSMFISQMAKNMRPPKTYEETEELWISVSGKKGGVEHKTTMICHVRTLPEWHDAGSNIDTGFPAAIIGTMIEKGEISQPGSFSPEEIVPAEPFFKKLSRYDMQIFKDGTLIN